MALQWAGVESAEGAANVRLGRTFGSRIPRRTRSAARTYGWAVHSEQESPGAYALRDADDADDAGDPGGAIVPSSASFVQS